MKTVRHPAAAPASDVASAIAYHKTAREIDVEFVGGGQNHPGRRLRQLQ